MQRYWTFFNGYFELLGLRDILEETAVSSHGLWSARLSTCLFGKTSCPSGNRGPKNEHEVLLGAGTEGLQKIIELGFIPCPTCKPEKVKGFSWEAIQPKVLEKYSIDSLEKFTDKKILGFDARRVSWEELLPIPGCPGRLYVPQGLAKQELQILKGRFANSGFDLPPTVFYDATHPQRFATYEI